MKKLLLLMVTVFVAVTVAACSTKKYTVTFDSRGGSSVDAVQVEKGKTVAEPDQDPTKSEGDKVLSFSGWYVSVDGANANDESKLYKFDTAVTADITLYAGWTDNVVLRFFTKTSETMSPVLLGEDGGVIASEPQPAARSGFVFKGWFNTKRGLTWLEPEKVAFPLNVASSKTLYAYWEPTNSVTINYAKDETYTSSITSDSSLILNPLVYKWEHESSYIDMMVTALYTTEVDWDKAIKQGVASEAGDFSKIKNNEFSIDALDYKYFLVGAAEYPKNSEGEDFLVDGVYDRDVARSKTDTKWTFTLRNDLKFQDGTPITAETFEYTLKQFLSKDQNNYRANIFYKNPTTNKNGYPIKNAEEYFKGTVEWSSVGFSISENDPYTFTIETYEAISQATAVSLANAIRLVHPAKYEASLTEGINSKYGTPAHPYVSYGPYVLKSWDANQKLVFNKNFDYVLKGTINYKSQVIQVVDNVDQRMQKFEQGELSVAGLSREYYSQYAEDSRVKKSWDGYPQYLVINTADSLKETGGHVHHEIMFDVNFRQALLFGFNRAYYATSVYQPNTASILPIPADTKQYLSDLLYYSQSPEHLALLEELGIDPKTEGYSKDKAIELFNEAYTAWTSKGNSGAVTIKLLTANDEFSLHLVSYIKESYESLFADASGNKRLIIELDQKDSAGVEDSTMNWDFDLLLASVGFGSSLGAFYQLPAFAFIGAWIGGGELGLSQPYEGSVTGAYLAEELTIDLTSTYTYLIGLSEEDLAERPGHALFLDWLSEEVNEETGDVIKEAGIFKGTVEDLALYVLGGYTNDTAYDGTATEPFPGATNDANAITAAFERVFLQYATLIPAVTRSSATIFASNVVIDWPTYSATFAWGAARYRYLNTDPDFQ